MYTMYSIHIGVGIGGGGVAKGVGAWPSPPSNQRHTKNPFLDLPRF